MPEQPIHVARFKELKPQQLYGILRLRSDVFIVEQQCAYADIDGRDADPSTVHMWIDDSDEVIACLRILAGMHGVPHIGRVVTHPRMRGRGIGERLMRAAVDLTGTPVEIKAQSRLVDWYARLGFVICGDEFDEDGILHRPMRLERR